MGLWRSSICCRPGRIGGADQQDLFARSVLALAARSLESQKPGSGVALLERHATTSAHRVLADAEVPVFENLRGLGTLPPTGAVVIALPMKIAGGIDGPLRAIALLPPR